MCSTSTESRTLKSKLARRDRSSSSNTVCCQWLKLGFQTLQKMPQLLWWLVQVTTSGLETTEATRTQAWTSTTPSNQTQPSSSITASKNWVTMTCLLRLIWFSNRLANRSSLTSDILKAHPKCSTVSPGDKTGSLKESTSLLLALQSLEWRIQAWRWDSWQPQLLLSTKSFKILESIRSSVKAKNRHRPTS